MSTWWAKQASTPGPSNGTSTTPATSTPAATGTGITASTFSGFFTGKQNAHSTTKTQTTQQETIPAFVSGEVLELLKGFRLEGADDHYETSMVFAKSHGQIMGGNDAHVVGLRWFRAAEGGKFEELQVTKPFFQPSVDDVDKRLCVQCYDLRDETSSSFAEYGPIKLNPKVTEALAAPDVRVKARNGLEEIEIARSAFPPNLVVLRRNMDGSIIEEHIPSWRIVANEAKRVQLGDGREIEFATSLDRDIATLLVRSNPTHKKKTSSITSLDEVLNDKNDKVESKMDSALEKQLKDRIIELEAQLMAARARGGAAETGKALAEAQSLRRELDKIKMENAALTDQLEKTRKAKLDVDERMKVLERDAAMATMKDQAQESLRKELETTKEALKKAQSSAKSARERAEKAETALDEYDRSVPALEARAKQAEGKVADLESRLAQAISEAERAVGRRNAAQQKADSLAKDLARMLRATPGGLEEVEAVMKENAILKTTVEELRAELRQTRSAYEAQLVAMKMQSAKAAVSLPSLGGSSASAAASVSKANQLELLANTLMNEVKSKDEIIESQAAELKRLNIRLGELQKRSNKDPSGNLSN